MPFQLLTILSKKKKSECHNRRHKNEALLLLSYIYWANQHKSTERSNSTNRDNKRRQRDGNYHIITILIYLHMTTLIKFTLSPTSSVSYNILTVDGRRHMFSDCEKNITHAHTHRAIRRVFKQITTDFNFMDSSAWQMPFYTDLH